MYFCGFKTSNNEALYSYFRPNHVKPRQRSNATSLCCFLSNSLAFLELDSQGYFTQPGCLSQLEQGGVERDWCCTVPTLASRQLLQRGPRLESPHPCHPHSPTSPFWNPPCYPAVSTRISLDSAPPNKPMMVSAMFPMPSGGTPPCPQCFAKEKTLGRCFEQEMVTGGHLTQRHPSILGDKTKGLKKQKKM